MVVFGGGDEEEERESGEEKVGEISGGFGEELRGWLLRRRRWWRWVVVHVRVRRKIEEREWGC